MPDDIAQLADGEKPVQTNVNPRRIELLAGTTSGAPNVAALDVLRADNQGFKELDEIYVILQLEHAQRLVYGRSKPRVTSIAIQLEHSDQIPEARARIEAMLPGLSHTWTQNIFRRR